MDTNKYYKVGKLPPGGFGGFGMLGMMGGFPVAPSVSPAPAATPAENTQATASDVKKCAFCGANVTGKFCSECGGKVE